MLPVTQRVGQACAHALRVWGADQGRATVTPPLEVAWPTQAPHCHSPSGWAGGERRQTTDAQVYYLVDWTLLGFK